MSTLFLPKSSHDKLKANTFKTIGSPIDFNSIKSMSINLRNKLLTVAQCLDQHACPERMDLTDECIAIYIDGESIEAIKDSGFSSFFALFGIENGHLTISLLGADNTNTTSPKISARYKTENIFGYETWPRRGVIGFTKEFSDVLDCK